MSPLNIAASVKIRACKKICSERCPALYDLETRFFAEDFSTSLGKETQWTAFVRKQGLEEIAPTSFREVTDILHAFFRPMVKAENSGKVFPARWITSGQWL